MTTTGVRLLTALAIALSFAATGVLVPWLLDLVNGEAWRATMIGAGVIFALGVYAWSLWALPSGAQDGSSGDAARRFPLRVAQVLGLSAVISALATLAVFSGHDDRDPVLVAVLTGLLVLLPAQVVYLAARRALRPIAQRGPRQLQLSGRRQPTQLSVIIVIQAPLLACGLAMVLVEQSSGGQYGRDIAAYHQDRYVRLLNRARDLLDPPQRAAMLNALKPPPTIVIDPRSDPVWRAGRAHRRPLTLKIVPYLLLLMIFGLTWALGRWMSRRLARELDTTRAIVDAILEGVPTDHADLALNRAVASRDMVGLVDAVGLALNGFERRRTALRRAAERRTASERAKARFLRHLSHELKSPLNSILGFSELLLARIDGPITPKQRDQLAAIWRSGESLERYILALLDLARLEEAGQAATRLSRAQTSAAALTRLVAEQIRPDPLAQRVIEVLSTGDAPCVIDLEQTARAVRLAAGLVADCLEEGTVRASIGPAPGGGVRVDLEVVDTDRSSKHTDRVEALAALRQSDGSSELAACLHLLRGVMAAQKGQFAMEIDDRGRPRCWLKLPAA